jgi:hypothetical protein
MKQQNVAEIFTGTECLSQPVEHKPAILTATVKTVRDDQIELHSIHSVFNARCAFSCLVSPEPGDKVSYLRDEHGKTYVLHVLERNSKHMSIKLPGNLDIQAKDGDLNLATSRELNMVSAKTCSLTANKISALASQGEFNIRNMRAQGAHLDSTINEINIVAQSITTIAGLLMQRVKNSIRAIEVLEKLDAGEVICNVKKLFSLRSRQTMLTAEQDVKIDGERVHIG